MGYQISRCLSNIAGYGYLYKMAPSKGDKSIERRNAKKKRKSKSAKQRLRSVKRLLSKPDLPATVRVSQERMLHLLQNTLEEEQQSRKDSKMIKKYKMVKFFEKRKLWRQLRATLKELEMAPSLVKVKELEAFQKKILKDMNYIEYFPSDRKYISLYPAKPYTNLTEISEQEEIHQHINAKVDAGELPQASTASKNVKTASKNVNGSGSKLKRKCKTSSLRIHMDKKTSVRNKSNLDLKDNSKSSLVDDDFFIDTSGDRSNMECQTTSN